MTAAFTKSSTAIPSWKWAGLAVSISCLALGFIGVLEMHHMSMTHGTPVSWHLLMHINMPRWIVLAVTLPLVLRIGVVVGQPGIDVPRVVAHVALFLLISWLHALMATIAAGLNAPAIVHLFPFSARLIRSWYQMLPTVVALYVAVLTAAWGMAEARERARRTLAASQLEAQLQSARLATLRARLQPHFLYNTLNGIAALVAGPVPSRAVDAIEQLGELLHASLRDDGREEVRVDEERALIRKYLELQKMRFAERLGYELHAAPAARECLVPVLLLQPIVENAVVHGLDGAVDRLLVVVTIEREGGTLTIRVENDGASLPDDRADPVTDAGGLGLAATRARLETAYGSGASLVMRRRDGGGVVVVVRMPARSAPAGQERS